MKNIFFKVLGWQEYWDKLWDFRKEYLMRVCLTFATIGLVHGIIFGKINFLNAFMREGVFAYLMFGFYLTSIRAWINNYLSADELAKKGVPYPAKDFKRLLPTYLINYPVILILLFVLISNLHGLTSGWKYGIAFIAGWAIDELWSEGRILGILKNRS